MSNSSLVTIIKGYEPFDLLRLSKDAFYDIVAEKFPKIDISDMKLSFVLVDGKTSIRAEITDYEGLKMNYEEAKKEFIKIIESYDYRYRKWEIFTDFCKISAISLYQPFVKDEDLEKEYLTVIAKYDKEDIDIFPKLLSLIVVALSDSMGDFLGECFSALNLSSKYKGQFFTPYYISKLMASLLGSNSSEHEGFSEPACGAGGMIIARADVLMKQGINYQEVMEVQAVDIDSLCVNMCYIQLTLLHISAEVIHGNSLTLEVFKTWYTPAYIMNATKRQVLSFDELKEEIKIKVPNDSNENKIFYSDEELEVFSTGRLFA